MPPPRGRSSTTETILFILVVLIGLYVLAQGTKDPDVTPVPPSVPTDVGTLKPRKVQP